MSFNGSGTFNINSTGQPVVSGTVISSTVFNALTSDLATGLTTCITKDGQTTVTNNIPLNNYRVTSLGAGVVGTDAANLSQVQSSASKSVTVTGTNTYTGTITPTLTAYTAGNTFTFVVPNTNTGACTINIDGLGAKAITRDGSTALVAGDLVANSEVAIVYDGTQFQVLNSNSKTNLAVSNNLTLSNGTTNQVQYLNGSKVLTGSANMTFDGTTLTANALNLTTALGATYGGTGLTSYAVGDLLYASTTTGLSKLADVATGNALISGGVGVAPSYGKIGLTTHVSGTLPVANGGTNATATPTAGAVSYGTGTAYAFNTAGTSGQALLSGGSGAPTFGTLGTGAGGTGLTSFTANGVVYASSTSALTTGSALVFDGTNLGVGVTPSAWGGVNGGVIQGYSYSLGMAAGGGTDTTSLATNAYYNGSNWIYRSSSSSCRYDQWTNLHRWYTASSGTQGNAITYTETMRLDGSGNLLVGRTTNLSVTPRLAIENANYGVGINTTNGGTNEAMRFYNAGTAVGTISTDGSSTAYNTSSDYRLKNNSQPLTGSGAFIDALQPKTWEWTADGSRGVGFIAHEVQAVSPKTVVGEKDAVDEDGNPVMQAMSYSSPEFIANIIAELQSLRARVAELEAKA
jgi:hypothetical protein